MGTTLTGTTPQDTYDSLIKVTDNGPISATAKFLSDGLGNDSALALSTATVGVGTASNSYTAAGRGNLNIAGSGGAIIGFQIGGTPKGYVFHDNTNLQLWNEVAGDLLFGANATERMRITSAGRVGIGVSDPNATLVVKNSAADTRLELDTEVAGTSILSYNRATLAYKEIYLRGSIIQFNPNDVNRVTVTTNGLTFNGDTAAANALDDYEEGTFTPTLAFGGASVGVTYDPNQGTYTKIGRQVTVNGRITLTSKGSSSGLAAITGLPFTIANTEGNWTSASFRFNNITFSTQIQTVGSPNSTSFVFTQTNGVTGVSADVTNSNFANNTEIQFSLTYFV